MVLPILKCDSCAADVQQQRKEHGLHVAQTIRILNCLPQYGINALAINYDDSTRSSLFSEV